MGLGPSNLAIIQADDDLRRLEWGDIEVIYDVEMHTELSIWLPNPVLPLFHARNALLSFDAGMQRT